MQYALRWEQDPERRRATYKRAVRLPGARGAIACGNYQLELLTLL